MVSLCDVDSLPGGLQIVINVALKEPGRLRSLLGMVIIIGCMVLLSFHRTKIRWHTVFWGFSLQFAFGLLVLNTNAGSVVITWATDRLTEFTQYSNVGAQFVFGETYYVHMFIFKTMPTLIVFCGFIQVLIHIGTIHFIVRTMGALIAFCLDISAPEAMSATANVFLGGPEASMVVVEYLDTLPASRLFTVMVNNMSSCGGTQLILFMSFGVPGSYLLAANFMSAPASLTCAKMMYPDADLEITDEMNTETSARVTPPDATSGQVLENGNEKSETKSSPTADTKPNKGKHRKPKSVIEALIAGARQGMLVISSIVCIIIMFLSALEMADKTVEWFGDRIDIHVTLKIIMSYIFYPFAYIMGVDTVDCRKVGELLGVRFISLAGVAYIDLGVIIENNKAFQEYSALYNETTWSYNGDDLFLENWNQTLTGGILTERSSVIATYAMCGSACLPSMGIVIGSLGGLAPRRVPDITRLLARTVIAGTFASYLTACIAGLIA